MTMQNPTVIALEEALAWARGEIRIEVRLPDGRIEQMNVMQYRRECEICDRLRAYRGDPPKSAVGNKSCFDAR